MKEKPLRFCSIDGCDRQLFAKGWCRFHYNRNYSYGDPLAGPPIKTPPAQCGVAGCPRNEVIRRGYCTVHYDRFMKTGDPGLPIGVYDLEKAKSNFWAKVDDSAGEDGCWPWTGRLREKGKGKSTSQGYGEHTIRGKTRSSHRIAYEFTHNVVLKPSEPIHHMCGNSICQNPKHLQITTPKENTAEMLERQSYLKRIAELEKRLETCNCT